MPSKETDSRIISSVQRALDIIALFDPNTQELGITEIAKTLGLHKSTASGLVYTLQSNGYIEQNPDNRKYRLGLQLLERATILLGQIEIRKVAMPELERLRDWSSESVNLAIREYNQVIYIERLLSDQNLGFRNHIGKRSWVHSTALGKAILSHLPPQESKNILESYDLVALTPRTIVDVKTLTDQFITFRKQGFAIEREEDELGGLCISAPLYNHTAKPIGAISVSFPISRVDEDMIPAYGEKISATAKRISEKLGYIPEAQLSSLAY